MELADYIAILLIKKTAEETKRQEGRRFIFKRSEAIDLLDRSTVFALSLSDEIAVDIALENLEDIGVVAAYNTPHAESRFSISFRPELYFENYWPYKGTLEAAMKAYIDLGDDWLSESIDGAISIRDDGPSPVPTSITGAWEPLPMERPDSQLDEVLESIEALAEQVRSDNGYAAEHAAERDEVVTGLKAAVIYLREASLITYTGVQVYIISPLNTLVERFGTAAIGVSSRLAWDLFKDWLKEKLDLA